MFPDYDFPVYNYKHIDKVAGKGISIEEADQLANEIKADYLLTVDITDVDVNKKKKYKSYDGDWNYDFYYVMEISFSERGRRSCRS